MIKDYRPKLLNWDASGTAGQQDGAGAWLGTGRWIEGSSNVDWSDFANAIFGVGGAGGAVTLASPIKLSQLQINAFTGTYTLGSANQLIEMFGGIRKSNGTGATIIISPIKLLRPQSWVNDSALDVTIGVINTGDVDNGGHPITVEVNGAGSIVMRGVIKGTGNIIKNGTGRLTLGSGIAPVHTTTGKLSLNAGVIMYSVYLPLGNLTINGGVMESYWTTLFSRTLGDGAGQVQILGGTSGFGMNGATGQEVRFNNNANFEVVWGSAFFNPSVFVFNSQYSQNNATLTVSNKIDLNGATRTIFCHNGIFWNAVGKFSNVIRNSTGTAGITKTGYGILDLSGANTYNGVTTIEAGTLRLIGSIAGAVVVTSGTLLGRITSGTSSTISGTVTVANDVGAIIRPGSYGNNTLNTGAVTFSGTSSRLTIDSTTIAMSKIAATGNVDLGGCGVIFNAGITTNGTYKIITCTGTMSGTLPSIITNSTVKTLTLQQTVNDLEVVVS